MTSVLAVDDNATNLAIMREILEDDYDLLLASDGEEALRVVAEHRPALVLLDIMMPGIDGYETCRRIKACSDARFTHVVLVSAKASTRERVRGYDSGADDYIIKPFDEEELLAKVRVQLRLREALVRLAEAQASVQQDNTRLSGVVEEQSRELIAKRNGLVFALAKLADSRDPETGEHLQRIRGYCVHLAQHLADHGPYRDRIDEAFIDAIYLAAPLHDIGKVGIPDAILLKPGRLTDTQFDLMKRHAQIGADALQEVADHGEHGEFLRMAVDIARSHHERWDGTGYPQNLAGEAIPLAARICAVADVFDALTSVRVYKAAFTLEVARTMIEEESGSHFDPAVVEAFLACYPKLTALRGQVGDPDLLALAA